MPRNEFDGLGEFADDLEDFAADIGRAADRVESSGAVDEGVRETATDFRDDAKRRAPRDTGELIENISAEQIAPGEWRVVSAADHARPVEFGARPHTITPTDADALRFEIDGDVVYASKVDHPGQDAQPYFRPAMDSVQSELARNISDAITRVVSDELSL